mgnify:CR=1 FL=1|tara:strand:+ start:1245 stop:1430 length:186 start_codon:yes stop_codon:yes gene_type:complete
MGNLEKLKKLVNLFKSQRSLQYGAVFIYLIIWLFSSGSLTTTILVGFGIGLGWLIGQSEEK